MNKSSIFVTKLVSRYVREEMVAFPLFTCKKQKFKVTSEGLKGL